MRIFKKTIPLFAAILFIAVFFMPVTVYAADESGVTETTSESAIAYSPKPFTPDGQATVIDWATEYDGKEFYSFQTPAGNVFYLIIDHARGADNVYFLNAVTEQDLIALAEQSKNNGSGISVIPTTESPTENKPDESPDSPGTVTPKQNDNTGLIIFVVIGVVAVGGIAYYMKIVRPKKQANNDDEDDDIPEDGGGEDIEFENEPEETDENSDNSDKDDE